MVCRKWYNASQDLQFQVKRRAAAPYETSGWRSRAPGARVSLLPAEERYLLLPGFCLVLGAHQGSWETVLLPIKHQPAGRIQRVQTAASGGADTLSPLGKALPCTGERANAGLEQPGGCRCRCCRCCPRLERLVRTPPPGEAFRARPGRAEGTVSLGCPW